MIVVKSKSENLALIEKNGFEINQRGGARNSSSVLRMLPISRVRIFIFASDSRGCRERIYQDR